MPRVETNDTAQPANIYNWSIQPIQHSAIFQLCSISNDLYLIQLWKQTSQEWPEWEGNSEKQTLQSALQDIDLFIISG